MVLTDSVGINRLYAGCRYSDGLQPENIVPGLRILDSELVVLAAEVWWT